MTPVAVLMLADMMATMTQAPIALGMYSHIHWKKALQTHAQARGDRGHAS